ncbi:MAG: hypothetical protein KatS3mg026_1127 [Bacteroidia bacterium]|nr:MAG: hypothetical protein KatS3mg026_1127 [Bacteroidia bacterium]
MQENLAMSQSGNDFFSILAAASLDSSNEEEIFLSLPLLVRGVEGPGRLRLYHALTPDRFRWAPGRSESFLQQIQSLKEQAEAQLSSYCKALQERLPAGWEVDYWIEDQEVASPAEEIANYLQRERFSLLVVAFKQRKRWEKFLGLTAVWDILEVAPIPVLILPAPFSLAPRRFLWVTDIQAEEFPLLHPLVRLIRKLKATLYCLKVNTPYSFLAHRTFQRHILEMCDYILEQVDPDFVPEECLLYADKELVEGIVHAAHDFLMDVVALSAEAERMDARIVDKLLAHQLPLLLLRQA